MAKGAIHPNGSNFTRFAKLDIMQKMRKLIEQKMYTRPTWLDAVEKHPPLELHNLYLNTKTIPNPYTSLVKNLLKKYPHLRFQDCYVDGNDWTKGNDTYRDDHPVMQFVAQQLRLMNQGYSKSDAFKKTEEKFYQRRLELEKKQKILMALSIAEEVEPMFTTGYAYWQAEIAKNETKHMKHIRSVLRSMRKEAEANQKVTDQDQQQSPKN